MAAPMFHVLKTAGRLKNLRQFLHHSKNLGQGSCLCPKRTLLSQAYFCNEEWTKQYESKVIDAVNIDDFLVGLHDKFEKGTLVPAVDIDILAHKIPEIYEDQIPLILTLLDRFHHTQESFTRLPSTHYAVVRSFIDMDREDCLLDILRDKTTYGIFPDDVTFSLLLDTLIEKNDYAGAARVAYELALQEDFRHGSTRLLSLLALAGRLCSAEDLGTLGPSPPEDDGEEVKVLVQYVREPYYDDHFDVRSEQHMLGKALLLAGQAEGGVIGDTFRLIGLSLFEKFDEALDLLAAVVEGKVTVYREAVERVSAALEGCGAVGERPVTEQQKEEWGQRLQTVVSGLAPDSPHVLDTDLLEAVRQHVAQGLAGAEAGDTKVHHERLAAWAGERERLVNEQIEALEYAEKRDEILARIKELQEKEEKFSFFKQETSAIGLAQLKAQKKRKRTKQEIIDHWVQIYKKKEEDQLAMEGNKRTGRR